MKYEFCFSWKPVKSHLTSVSKEGYKLSNDHTTHSFVCPCKTSTKVESHIYTIKVYDSIKGSIQNKKSVWEKL